ncbi:MAG: hypothetical protein ACR2QM_19640 [Longimicrobiales bacterium]
MNRCLEKSRTLFAVVLFPLLGGCYSYTPSALGDLSAGDEVRARLTAAQFDELEEHIPGGDRVVEGEVVEVGASRMLLEVPVNTAVQGIRVQSLKQRFEIPADGMADVELRTLDRRRTYGLSAVGVAVIGYIVWDQLLSEGRRGGTDTPEPPDEDRRITFKIPFRLW